MTNRLTLAATLTEPGALRYTPAGIPVIECVLQHRSVQAEAGAERRVDLELAAVAVGSTAVALADVAPGASLLVGGFLARRYRTGVTLALHINEFELCKGN